MHPTSLENKVCENIFLNFLNFPAEKYFGGFVGEIAF